MYSTLKGKRGGHPTLTCKGCLYTSNISEPRCRDILPSDHFTIRALDSLTALPSLSNTVRHRIVFSTFSLSLEITSFQHQVQHTTLGISLPVINTITSNIIVYVTWAIITSLFRPQSFSIQALCQKIQTYLDCQTIHLALPQSIKKILSYIKCTSSYPWFIGYCGKKKPACCLMNYGYFLPQYYYNTSISTLQYLACMSIILA